MNSFKHLSKCDTVNCAEFSNRVLREDGNLIYGDAWNPKNVDLLYSGYQGLQRPEIFNKDIVEQYNNEASDNFYKNFDSNTLDKSKKYSVNMYYVGSPYLETAFNNGRDNISGTHTGVVLWNQDKNQWEVIHNVHGTILVDPFTKIQGGNKKYGITAIYEQRPKNLVNQIKNFLKFQDGGNLNIMKTIQIEINDKTYNVLLAQTEEEKEQGLMNVEELDSNEGMLFIYDSPQHVDFWMKNTEIPLDIIFIDEDLEVISVKQGTPLSEEYISEDNVQFVLELNQNSGVKPGDEIDIEDDLFEDENSELEPNKIYVIGPDGKPQAEILGGERIFSIKNTKTLIRMAKRAFISKTESDYKKLGRKIFEYLHTQDTNKPEYTNIKKDE